MKFHGRKKSLFAKILLKSKNLKKNEFLEPIVEPKKKIYQLFFSKKEIECYYCEGNEIKCFLSSKFSSLPSLKENFIKKSKSKHHIDMNKTLLRKILQSFGKKLQKKTNKK